MANDLNQNTYDLTFYSAVPSFIHIHVFSKQANWKQYPLDQLQRHFRMCFPTYLKPAFTPPQIYWSTKEVERG